MDDEHYEQNERGRWLLRDAPDLTALGGDGADIIYGGTGNHSLLGQGGNDRLQEGVGIAFLARGQGDDRLDGGIGSQILNGGAGKDTLIGGTADQTPIGGAGRDDLQAIAGWPTPLRLCPNHAAWTPTTLISCRQAVVFGDRIGLTGLAFSPVLEEVEGDGQERGAEKDADEPEAQHSTDGAQENEDKG